MARVREDGHEEPEAITLINEVRLAYMFSRMIERTQLLHESALRANFDPLGHLTKSRTDSINSSPYREQKVTVLLCYSLTNTTIGYT